MSEPRYGERDESPRDAAESGSDLRVGAAEPARNRWPLVVAAGLAVFMAVLDATIVTVALPVVEHEFGTVPSLTEWVVLGYLVPMIALALPSGRWLEQVGRRPALVLAAAGFGLASVVAGLAPGIGWLIAARVVQGSSGAILFALVPAVASAAVRPEFRGRALGVIGTLGPLGGFAGPTLGGLLVDRLGWPWIFFVNVPVVALIVAVASLQLPPGRPLRLPDRSWLAESAVLVAGVSGLLLGFSLGAEQYLWLLLVLPGGLVLLAWRRMRVSGPLRSLLRTPGLAGPHLALVGFAVWASAVQYVIPFFLLRVVGVPVDVAGLTVAAFAIAQGVVGLLGGALADWFGAKRVAVLGALISAVGLLLVLPLGEAWLPVDLAWRLAVAGVGAGMFNSANLALAMSRTPLPALTGASTSTARQLGFGLGPALSTLAWAASGYTVVGMRTAIAVATLAAASSAMALLLPGRRAADEPASRHETEQPRCDAS